MKTINKCFQTLTTPALKSIINNKTTLFLIVLFLLFKQTIQSQTNFTENFSSDSTISYASLDWLENNSYTDNLDLEENSYVNNNEIVSDTNNSSSLVKNSTFREVANDDFKSIEETNNTTQLHYIVEQEFTTTLSLENIAVANQPFPNPDTDGDGVNDDIDIDDDNDGILDFFEQQCSSVPNSNNSFANSGTYNLTGDNGGLTIDITRLDNSFNMEINGTKLVTTEVQFDVSSYNSSGGQSLVRFVSDDSAYGENGIGNVWNVAAGSPNSVSLSVVINPLGEVSLYGSRTSTGPLELMYIQNGDPQFNNITLNESSNNTVVITQVPVGATYIYGGYYFSELTCLDTDTDQDGIPNRLDLDSDGDGCLDTIEAGTSNDDTTTDANNNGLLDQYEDGTTGTINYVSSYSAYAIDDAINACTDTDGDGVNDVFDLDDDNDGVLDTKEGAIDTDGDGILNSLDLDSDGDGCSDALEAGATTNTTADYVFTGAVGTNGLVDTLETAVDSGIINYTSTYNPYALNDTVNSCIDTDSDGVNDVFDIDDDNDGVLDTEEGCQILAYDLTSLTWETDAAMTVFTANSSTLQGTSTSSWKSALSTQTFSLPLDISFTYSETTREVMVGFAPENTVLNSNWNINSAFGFYIYNTNTKARYNSTNGGTVTSNSNGKTHRIVIDAAGNLTTYIDGQVSYEQTGLSTGDYKVYIAHNSGTNKPLENVALRTANYPLSCELDTDGDGTPNGLDLDSDGDGCSDALEAGATTDTTTDYVFTGAVGANGLVDALETAVDSGIINYASTYNPYAISDFLAGCVDTDNDGVNDLLDLDDDNDGILDATESPSCYYLAGEVAFTSATTSLTNYNTSAANSFTELYDGVLNNMAAFGVYNTSITDETVYELELLFPVELSEIDIVFQYSVFRTGAEFKWQGYNGSTWVDVTGTLTETETTNNTYTYSLNSTGTKYYSYRLQGISGATYHNRIYEIVPKVAAATYQSSLHPKDNCSVDTDGDGTYNHLDTDSDDDGCIDTIEAGTSNDGTTTDANNNGLLDQYEDGTTGTINYVSSYSTYAINDAINACTDTDGDGVNDVFDLDDDNDGILDTVEQQVSPDSSFDSSVASTGVTMTGLGGGLFSGGYLFSTGSNSNYVAEISKTMDGASAGSPFEISLKGIQSTSADNSSYFRIKVHIGNTEIYNELLADIIAVSEPANINLEGIITENNPTLKIIIDRSQDDVNTDPRIESFDYTVYDGDEDNDGIPNHLDLDSDADGCSDSIEGVSPIPAWTPAELTTQLWLDAADASTIEGDGGKVSQWDDKSGNNNHATQSNVANQPTKGIDKISFIGGNDNMVTNSPINNTDIDIYYVRKQPSASSIDFSGGGYAICSKNGDGSGINSSFGTPSYYVNGTSETPANRDQMHDIIDDNTMKILSVVGGNLSSWSSFGLSTYGGEWRFDGDFYEIILVDGSNVDIETRQKIEGYLAHKWGLAANLPIDHPYKDIAPFGAGSGATCNIFTKPSNNSTSVYNTGDDTNNNGLLDAFEGAEAGTTNYTSSYVAYALDNTINACTDSDGDDVGDIFDLDDDNDGVLDTTEGTGDTDGDGTPNHLDTDSDGDGCLDTIEAGTTNNGDTTDANCNGLLDQYEDGVTNTINYASTYNPYAVSDFLAGCVDTDNDGVNDLLDLDDDNDGILDATESPSCYYLASEVAFTSATTSLTNYNTSAANSFTELYDGVLNNMAAFGVYNTSITDETVYELELLFPVELSEIDIVFQYSVFRTGAEFKWQGYNGSTWVDVTGTLTETETTNNTYTYSLNSTGTKYYSYRLQGISGATYHNRIYEIVPKVAAATYQSSLHPKDNCSVDTDGDGTYNHLDTDSDGDTCLDTIEAGTSNDGTTTDANNNGLLDQYEDGSTGTINYTSTYNAYAINDAINACTDTDDDGVNDVFDLDDDNDGVLDTDEDFSLESLSLLWLDASDPLSITKDSNGLVSQWNDKSGNGHHATQSTPANQPTFDTDQINGGTSDWLNLPSDIYAGKTEGTLIIVGEQTGGNAAWGNYGTSTNHTAYGNINFYDSFLATGRPHIGTTIGNESTLNRKLIYSVINDGSTLKVRSNGEDLPNGGDGITFDDSPAKYELFRQSNYTLYEVIFLENDSSIQEVEGYLAHKWGLEASLPAGHPYKDFAISNDVDGDGIPNSLDLDSDGDTCIDTIEAGTSNDGTTTDANNNGLLDQYEDGTTGTINYVSSYSAYAIDDAINACTDTDGDGVGDITDLDDDNDGILDIVEDNLVSSLTAVAGASAITIDSNNFTVNNISGGWGAGSVHSNDLGIAPNEDFTLSLEVELFSQRYIMIGLNASGNNSTNLYSDIDYALYFYANSVIIYENNSSKGTQSTVTADSDVFSIERVGTTITYSKNGTVFYTSLTASSATDYYIDSSMHDNGNNGYTISNIWVTTGSSFDTDGDGIPNSLDLDSDNDGILDNIEAQNYSTYIAPSGVGSGIIDINGNGLDDAYEFTPGVGLTPVNSDTDSLENFVDIDADNDGIPDNVELQRTKLYIAPSGIATLITDVNSNGVDDNYESGGTVGITPVDTELDGIPDYVDTDTDNDGILDIAENGNNNNVTSGTDTDEDGLDDNFDNYDDTNISGHTVNNGINPPNASNLGDIDNDFATGGDVDFRDNDKNILITQVYQSAGKKMIEVTNIGASEIQGSTFSLNLFRDNPGDLTTVTPTASYTIATTLNANQSIVIENSTGGDFSNINSGAISITDNDITDFSDGNDIIILSTTSDDSSWTNRLDVIHSVNNITSMVSKDEESNPLAAHDSDRWSVFIDDNLDPYRDDTFGGAERHPHDPLISEIDDASDNSNAQLGYHRTGVTNRTAGAWSNGTPDRSRRVIINEDYLHNDGSLSARQLTIDNNSKLTVEDELLIVSELVTITGINDEIRLAGPRSQLITTHSGESGISGIGKLYVDQNSDIVSTYRYNYFSSPVTTVGQNTFSVASVMKDGTIATSEDSNPLDMNFTNEMDGTTGTPITIADYWIYSYGSSSDWVQTRKNGSLLPANGFTFKGPGIEQNYTFVGTPNDGLITTTVGANASYLVGNPFPSALNSKKFLEDNSVSINGTMYLWEQQAGLTENENQGHNTSNYVGGYATRNLSMGIAAPNDGGGTYKIPGKYIAVAQGFFITGSSIGGQLIFSNSQREYKTEGEDSIYFRDGENNEVSETHQDPIVKIGLDYTNGEGQNLHRQLGVSFNENRSFSFDLGYDSPLYEPLENDIQYRNEETKMFWKFEEDDTKYVIAGIQEFSTDIEIPIGFSLEYDGEIVVKLDEQQNLEQDVYLKDEVTGATYKLSDNEQGVVITLTAGSHLDKYSIVFVESSLSIDDDMLLENQLGVYVDNIANKLVIKNYANLDIKKLELYNILGQSIKTWNNLGAELEYRMETKIPAGIYIVRVTLEEGQIVKKIRVD